mmetsp:Transcript_21146/g.55024  ORF Transcript_21146/g.55024 Transcript_21146/m.55024 type:complete len:632 (-) Transcript_21146:203-2098(-)
MSLRPPVRAAEAGEDRLDIQKSRRKSRRSPSPNRRGLSSTTPRTTGSSLKRDGEARGSMPPLGSGVHTPPDSVTRSKRSQSMPVSLQNEEPDFDEGLIQASLRKFIIPMCMGSSEGEPTIPRRSFIQALQAHGLDRGDPRLVRMFEELDDVGGMVPIEDMLQIAGLGGQTVFDALSGEMVIPRFNEFREECKRMFEKTRALEGGTVSDYIPQLARVDATKFAMSVTTVDGQTFSFGDHDEQFCMQSVSKPITYMMAVQEHGLDKVHRFVGREPSGATSKAMKLKAVPADAQDKNGHKTTAIPYNPLTNSGALVCTSMIQDKESMADRMDGYLSTWTQLCGTKVGFDPAVMVSERSVADRNTALGFMCKGVGAFPDKDVDLEEQLELYNATNAVTANSHMISVAAATLANGGVNPLTGHSVFAPEVTRAALSLMLSCGMYDSSGEWSFDIGLPAKTSISGVLMMIVPNVMGICIYSPALDDKKLPLKGVALTKRLVDSFAFHHLDSIGGSSSKRTPTAQAHMTETELMYAMMCAAASGDVMKLQQLISAGGSVSHGDYDRRTPLHLAASEAHVDAVDYLLAQGADVGSKDRFGHTAYDDAIQGQKAARKKGKEEVIDTYGEIIDILADHFVT